MKIINKIKEKSLSSVIILAFGIGISGFFVGNGAFRAMAQRTVTVKGLAEMDVVADNAVWSIKYNSVGSDLTSVQKDIDENTEKVYAFLIDNGFKNSEIQNLRVQVRDKYTSYSEVEKSSQTSTDRFVIETGVIVRSSDVYLVDSVSRKLGELVRQGVPVIEDYTGPIYAFNGLNEIKIKMIEQATKNATAAGEQFAKDANAKLGKIQSANQGVFSVSSRDPIDTWDDEKKSINKRVRVVSTITFYLR